MREFDKVRSETVKFLRGKYRLDEVAGMKLLLSLDKLMG